nr:hypothetical protein [Tanacetum cinerariifolium]
MYYCDILHVCSPKICNLTVTDIPAYAKVLNVVAPKLDNLTASISTCGGCCSVDFLQLSIKDFSSLEKTLSSNLDQLFREPGPFQNLKSVKINSSRLQHTDPIPTTPLQVRDYFLENSPNATFIIDPPQ